MTIYSVDVHSLNAGVRPDGTGAVRGTLSVLYTAVSARVMDRIDFEITASCDVDDNAIAMEKAVLTAAHAALTDLVSGTQLQDKWAESRKTKVG